MKTKRKSQICFVPNTKPKKIIPFGDKISLLDDFELFYALSGKLGQKSLCYGDIILAQQIMYTSKKSEKHELHICTQKPKCIQCANIDTTNMTYQECVQTCLNNMKNGKCKDAFMINTVGYTLFPERYWLFRTSAKTK